MPVGSFVEMVMTTFGWQLYNIVWGVLSSTGLAYLPFIAVIIDNVISPVESQEARSAAATSLRRLEIDIIRIVIVIFLAVSPFFTLTFGSVTYTNSCSGGNKVSQGATNTTYDDHFNAATLNGQTAKIPPWFYLIMSVSGGVNDAVISALPCKLADIRQLESKLNSNRITEPSLRNDAQKFFTDCFLKARAKFILDPPSDVDNEDIMWLGSSHFITNYYPILNADSPTKPFVFDPTRQKDKEWADLSNPPQYGYPTCDEWWGNPDFGIKKRLIDDIAAGEYLPPSLGLSVTSSPKNEEVALKKLISNEGVAITKGLSAMGSTYQSSISMDRFSEIDGFADAFQAVSDVRGEIVGGALSAVGGVVTDLLIQPALTMTILGAPIAQSVLLMLTYFLLPIALMVGNYEWGTVRTATVAIFAIKFWTVIWAVVSILDHSLLLAISGSQSGVDGILNSLNSSFGPLRVIVDVVILGLYWGAPLYLLSLLAWGGEREAGAGSQASNTMAKGSAGIGDKGASVAASAIKR